MHFGHFLELLSQCFTWNNSDIRLPDELVCKILTEYLPDQPQNRLVSRRVRDEMDRVYDGIAGFSGRRGLVNLEAVMKLRSRNTIRDRIDYYLSDDDRMVRRMAIRLIKELRLSCSIEVTTLIRLLREARTLKEFNTILSISQYRNFEALRLTDGYRNLRETVSEGVEDGYEKLRVEQRISDNMISYYRGFSAR